MNARFVICVFIGLFLSICINAQIPNRFLLFDVNAGLSQNSVTCFFEDSRGLLWIGTQDGLNSFDGRTFKQYASIFDDTSTLSHKYILKIAEDKLGNLWIGTAFGLNKLNTKTGKVQRVFINFKKESKFSISPYESFYINDRNALILFRGKITYTINCKSLQVSQIQSGSHTPHCISSNRIGQYVLRNDSLINLQQYEKSIDVGGFIDGTTVSKISANSSYALMLSKSPKQEVLVLDLQRKQLLYAIPSTDKIFDIAITANHTVQLCTDNGFKAFKIGHPNSSIRYDENNPQSIPSGPILCSYEDSKHNLWIGTAASGIAVQPAAFTNFEQIANPHKKDAIQDIYVSDKATFIAANTGVYRIVNNRMQLVKSFGSNRVNAVCYWNGLIYVSVEQQGIYVLTSQGEITHTFQVSNSILESNQIFSFKEIDNHLGLCTEKYFYTLNNNHQLSKLKVDAQKGNYAYVLDCYQDANRNIYLATNNGIALLSPEGKTKQFFPSMDFQDIFGKTIISSVSGYGDSIMVSTLDNGIFILQNHRVVKHYYYNHGLPNNAVYKVVRTGNGNLWACTNAGIAILSLGQSNFSMIRQSQGLPNSYYSFGSIEAKGNNIYVGTDQGLFIAVDSALNISPIKVQPFVENISLNGRSIDFSQQDIMLDAYQKNVELQFGHATTFDNMVFAYQLNNSGWEVLPLNQNRINFSNFPLGKNTLKIKCASAVSEIKEAWMTTYSLHVKIPWHLRWYTMLFFCVMGGLLLYSIIAYYFKLKNEKRIRKYENELKLQNERERISRDLHDNLGSYATALLSKIQQMRKLKDSKDLDDMNILGTNIISNIRETIWIMQTKDIKIQDFSDKIKNYILKLKPVYTTLHIKVTDEITENVVLSPTVTTHLFRIIQEAIQNCVKHAQATELNILFQSKMGIIIRIEDNGIGYATNKQDDHYGIQNMRHRATEMGFSFEIGKSAQGTLIILKEAD